MNNLCFFIYSSDEIEKAYFQSTLYRFNGKYRLDIFEFSKIVIQLLLYRGRRDRIRDDVRVHAHVVVYFIPDEVTQCVIVNGLVNVTGQGMAAFKAEHFPGCGCVPRWPRMGWGTRRRPVPL